MSAFYFGDWHVDPQMSALHGAGWTEFDIVPHARPRFPGHLQPNIPLEDAARGFGVNVSEALPEVMAKKIEAATSHGVGSKSMACPGGRLTGLRRQRPLLPTVFLFDWYWYASPTLGGIPDLQGPGGGTFLGEEGIRQAIFLNRVPTARRFSAHA